MLHHRNSLSRTTLKAIPRKAATKQRPSISVCQFRSCALRQINYLLDAEPTRGQCHGFFSAFLEGVFFLQNLRHDPFLIL